MSLINKVISSISKSRTREVNDFQKNPNEVSQRVFFELLREGENTIWGKKYRYHEIMEKPNFSAAYHLFKNQVPLYNYDLLSPWIERIVNGQKNVLWPNEPKWFAKSSGMTSDKSKFIPVTKESLNDCHYQAAKDLVALYLKNNPESKVATGKTLSIGGSYSSDEEKNGFLCGDLSAILMDNVPLLIRRLRVPSIEVALLEEWEEKIEKICEEAIKEDVVAIAGVPSWTLIILRRILEITGKRSILEVWPNLELFVHGGVSFAPYQNQFKELIPSRKMNYWEVYNASEGFFAMNEKPSDEDMLLLLDYGVFYEFIPMDEFGKENPDVKNIHEIEVGENYALVISTNGGLWRYIIGDTVEITSIKPVRIKITGRTKHFINVFGEELMVSNADRAIKEACEQNDATVKDYTASPIYLEDDQKGGHEWLIEFSRPPEDLQKFAKSLDKHLKSINSDYEAKRYQDIVLGPPKVHAVRKNLFYDWLKERGKLGGQNKVPRLFNQRDYVDQLLKFE